MLDLQAYLLFLTACCERYERLAPTVHAHCDDLYRRINEAPEKVTLAELSGVAGLQDERLKFWLGGNAAANLIYKLRHRLGFDVTGQAGF